MVSGRPWADPPGFRMGTLASLQEFFSKQIPPPPRSKDALRAHHWSQTFGRRSLRQSNYWRQPITKTLESLLLILRLSNIFLSMFLTRAVGVCLPAFNHLHCPSSCLHLFRESLLYKKNRKHFTSKESRKIKSLGLSKCAGRKRQRE